MKSIPFILRDHREQLWRGWTESMDGHVPDDYRELMNSPLGERHVRSFIDDLISWSEAESYEKPAAQRQACDRVRADASNRMALGFTHADMVGSLHALRGAVVDVLLDALVLDELPSFAETLEQLKAASAFIDQLCVAVLEAAPPPREVF